MKDKLLKLAFGAVVCMALVACGTVGGLYQPAEQVTETSLPDGGILLVTNTVWTVHSNATTAMETAREIAPALPYGELIGLTAGGLLALAGWVGKIKNRKEAERARAIITSVVRGVEAGSQAAGEQAGAIVKNAITESALKDGTASELHSVVKETTK